MRKEKRIPYEIRWATSEDWPATMTMIWKTFMKFEAQDYSREGILNFREFITNGMIYHMFQDGRYPMLVATDGERIIGEISVRNHNHISLLFVDEDYHKQGIGSELIRRMGEYLKEEKHEIYMSVKAAPYAVGFYRKQGFCISSPEEEYSGIRVTSMEKFL